MVTRKAPDFRPLKHQSIVPAQERRRSRVATVTVKVTASNISGTGKLLVGVLSSLRFEGDCPLGAGERKSSSPSWKKHAGRVQQLSGNMGWTLAGSELSVALNGTRVEIFFIYGKPHKAYKDGVSIEALRFLATSSLLRGAGVPADAVAKVVRYCRGHRRLKYDSLGGGRSQVDNTAAEVQVVRLHGARRGVRQLLRSGSLPWSRSAAPPDHLERAMDLSRPVRVHQADQSARLRAVQQPLLPRRGAADQEGDGHQRRQPYVIRQSRLQSLGGKILDACAGPQWAPSRPPSTWTAPSMIRRSCMPCIRGSGRARPRTWRSAEA